MARGKYDGIVINPWQIGPIYPGIHKPDEGSIFDIISDVMYMRHTNNKIPLVTHSAH